MIILGVVLIVLGFWLFPDLLPTIPPAVDTLFGDLGVLILLIGVLLWIFGAVGRPVGGRRYWF